MIDRSDQAALFVVQACDSRIRARPRRLSSIQMGSDAEVPFRELYSVYRPAKKEVAPLSVISF